MKNKTPKPPKQSKPMWIRWKYHDHGAGGFRELELPAGWKESYETVEGYLCELGLVPTHSERFMMGRIEWKRLRRPSDKALVDAIINASGKARHWSDEAMRLHQKLFGRPEAVKAWRKWLEKARQERGGK